MLRFTSFNTCNFRYYLALLPMAQLCFENFSILSSPSRKVPIHRITCDANRVRDRSLFLLSFTCCSVKFRVCSCQASLCNKLTTSQSALEIVNLLTNIVINNAQPSSYKVVDFGRASRLYERLFEISDSIPLSHRRFLTTLPSASFYSRTRNTSLLG